MRAMLDIEFGNLRIYINQTALSAVIERCIEQGLSPVHATSSPAAGPGAAQTTQAIPVVVLVNQMGFYRPFIEDVVDAAQKVLSTVEDLCATNAPPSEGLIRFAPGRIFLRIFAIATILLKVVQSKCRLA